MTLIDPFNPYGPHVPPVERPYGPVAPPHQPIGPPLETVPDTGVLIKQVRDALAAGNERKKQEAAEFTRRDRFALAAMEALFADPHPYPPSKIAEVAYQLADAMEAARSRKPTDGH